MGTLTLTLTANSNSYSCACASRNDRRRGRTRLAVRAPDGALPGGRARHWRRARGIRQRTQSRLTSTAAEGAARGGQCRAASAASFALPITAVIEDKVVAANLAKFSNVKATAATLTCRGPENATAGAPTAARLDERGAGRRPFLRHEARRLSALPRGRPHRFHARRCDGQSPTAKAAARGGWRFSRQRHYSPRPRRGGRGSRLTGGGRAGTADRRARSGRGGQESGRPNVVAPSEQLTIRPEVVAAN